MTERTFSPAQRKTDNTNSSFQALPKGAKVLVAGAGVFGSWIALMLQESGYQVTLIDPWGPGNAKSSSGGDNRLVRTIYGDNALYFEWTLRSIDLWEKYQKLFDQKVYHQIGTLWFCHDKDDSLINAALSKLSNKNIPHKKLSLDESAMKYPLINLDDLEYLLWEEHSGYVLARASVMEVSKYFQKMGGKFIQAKVDFENWSSDESVIGLNTGEKISYDLLVAACGPWLVNCFPDVMRDHITVTKQDVLFFDVPDNQASFFQKELCSWVDQSTGEFYYGLPQGTNRGFKVALDRRGLRFDPDHDDRVPDLGIIEESRAFIGHRFPMLKDTPLLESRTCQYANTVDGNFICDLHPDSKNVLLIGGGSGHGFKHGPALGEYVARLLAGQQLLKPAFLLNDK